MTKTMTLAALLLSACATSEGEITVGPELGDEPGVQNAPRVTGVVHGASEGRVVLGNDAFLASSEIARGGFSFEGVPDGTYFLKLEAAGFAAPTQTVVVEHGKARVVLTATALPAGTFSYLWHRDATQGGHEQGSVIGAARAQLRAAYNIELSDEDQVWTDEHAARLLQTMKSVPQPSSAAFGPAPLAPTTWVLSSGAFSRDAEMVFMPAAAFASTSARFFPAQLHTEIVNIVTSNGRNMEAVTRILDQRFHVRAHLFQDSELVPLISRLEEMPERLRAVPALHTIIRRTGGAPARANVAQGYLEIADTAFTMDRSEAQFDIIREKARFVVTPELQAQWGTADVAAAIASFVVSPNTMSPAATELMSGLRLDPEKPITNVAIRAEDRNVTVELGLSTTGTSSAMIYLFNEQSGRIALVNLDPTSENVVRGDVSLPAGGTWRPDVIVLRDATGAASVRDASEVGWRLEVE